MSPLIVVKSFYEALGRGDVGAVVALFADKIEWTEAEGFPYHKGTWRTSQEVIDNLFIPLGLDWDGFSACPTAFVNEVDQVVAFGTYGGSNRASGRALNAPFAHHWRVVDGRVTSFVQYTDTALVLEAMRG